MAVLPFVDAGMDAITTGLQLWQYLDQKKFQERMANTAHRREMQDLKVAGINPLLTVMGGHGAPSPAGSTITPSNSGKSLAMSVAQSNLMKAQQKNQELTNANIIADTAKKLAEEKAINTGTKLAEQDVLFRKEQTGAEAEKRNQVWIQNQIEGMKLDFYMNKNSGIPVSTQKEVLERELMQFDIDYLRKLQAAGKLGEVMIQLLKAIK